MSPADGLLVNLRDYARTLRKRWVFVLVCTLIALASAGALTLLSTPIYESRTQLFVSARSDGGGVSGAYQGGLFAQQRVKSYADIVDSPAVTDGVAEELGVPASELAGKVTASVPLDTVLIDIAVTDESPERASQIAAAVAAEFSALIPTLEASDSSGTSPVKVSVVKEAQAPLVPSSPRPKVNLALGLLVGLGLGAGTAVLRESLDTSVKGKDDLQKITGSAPLGVIAADPGVAARPLVVQIDSQSPRAESFRQLRSNLQFVDVDRQTRAVVITSPVAGEGKSTTACNLAITMAQAGVRTILVEADLRRPRVADYLGIEGAVGLTSVLTGVASLDEAMQVWGRDGMMVLASGPLPPNPSEVLGSHHMLELLKTLDERADIVILDAPPLLPVTDAAVLARIADGAVLVVRHGHTHREQVTRALEALQGIDARVLGTVLNYASVKGPDADAYGYGYGYYGARESGVTLGERELSKASTVRSRSGARRRRT